MAIAKMKQFSLLTFEEHKEDLLKKMQLFENVHFRKAEDADLDDLELERDGSSIRVSEYENQLAKIAFTMDKIKPYLPKTSSLQALRTPKPLISFEDFDSYLQHFDLSKTYEDVRELDEQRKASKNEQNRIKAESDLLNSWSELDATSSDFSSLKLANVAIGTIAKMPYEEFIRPIVSQFDRVYTESLGNVKGENAVMIAWLKEDDSELAPVLKNLGFSRTTLPLDRLPQEQVKLNDERISALVANEEEISSKIEEFASKQADLEVCHDYYQTALARANASNNFLKSGSVIIVEGWVPCDDFDNLLSIFNSCCGDQYYLESDDVEKDPDADVSEIPVKLKNNKVVSSFEDITTMYSVPRYNEIDPTPLLTPFYLLFFAIMVGDAGYGVIVTIGTFLALKFLNFKEGMRRMISFFFYLGILTIFAGLLFGSAFGVTFFKPIQMANGEYKPILDSQMDIITMLIMSVAVGFIQIVFALGVKGYMLIRDGKPWSALFDSGFFIIMLFSGVGMLLGGMGIAPAMVFSVSKVVFFASLVGIGLTSGRENATIVGKAAGGLYGVYGLTSYVGDLVSYTRLVALSLSSAYIAYSFNLMAGLVPSGILRVIFGSLIFLFGQILNLALGLLSAYVHSCRLQYVEYFGKFYEGGGIAFNPLRVNNTYVEIKK